MPPSGQFGTNLNRICNATFEPPHRHLPQGGDDFLALPETFSQLLSTHRSEFINKGPSSSHIWHFRQSRKQANLRITLSGISRPTVRIATWPKHPICDESNLKQKHRMVTGKNTRCKPYFKMDERWLRGGSHIHLTEAPVGQERRRNALNGLLTESQCRNLALTILCASYSLQITSENMRYKSYFKLDLRCMRAGCRSTLDLGRFHELNINLIKDKWNESNQKMNRTKLNDESNQIKPKINVRDLNFVDVQRSRLVCIKPFSGFGD